jgi:hypothetical protein
MIFFVSDEAKVASADLVDFVQNFNFTLFRISEKCSQPGVFHESVSKNKFFHQGLVSLCLSPYSVGYPLKGLLTMDSIIFCFVKNFKVNRVWLKHR